MGELKAGRTPIPQQVKIDLLRKVCSVLNDNGIDYFLTCGTLLGYLREGNFIEWDTDIDLGLFEIEVFKSIIPDLQAGNLIVNRFSPEHSIRMSLSYQIYDGDLKSSPRSHVDIFEFEKTSRGILFRMVNIRRFAEKTRRILMDKLGHHIEEEPVERGSLEGLIEVSGLTHKMAGMINMIKRWAKRCFLQRQYLHIFEPFHPVDVSWFDMPVKIPSNPEDHLRLFYGDDWRIPIRGYDQSLERQNNIWRVRL